MKIAITALFAIAAGLFAGCASSPSSSTAANDGTIQRGSGVTVFGTIDAGVSRYEKK
jgi:type IV pilus biogenesis protein CpaD/CtpE